MYTRFFLFMFKSLKKKVWKKTRVYMLLCRKCATRKIDWKLALISCQKVLGNFLIILMVSRPIN